MIELQKQVFVEVAEQELERNEAKITQARLSALTGVHRKDVARLKGKQSKKEEPGNITSRVIGLWREHPRYRTKNNRPRPLTYQGSKSEFYQLVRLVSSDIAPSSVLLALESVGAVEKANSKIKLKTRAYRPEKNPAEVARLLAGDVEDLTEAVLENIESDKAPAPHYHGKSIYDNIALDHLPEIQSWLQSECDKFQDKIEKYLATHDLDLNENLKEEKGGGRVVLGVFTRSTSGK